MLRRLPVLTLAAVFVALPGCGSSGDDAADSGRKGFERVLKKVDGLHGEQRAKKLEAMAKAEGGELNVYTSLNSDQEAEVADAFESDHDIDLSVYRATSTAVAQRVSQEAKAGFRGADAVETSGSDVAALAAQGLFVRYRPEAAGALIRGSLQDGWTADRFNKFTVSWNTNLVPRGRQPRSWEGLADRRWRGRLALEESDADWYKSLREYFVRQTGSEAGADRLLEGIAANSRVVSSHAVETELLAAGEFAVAPANYIHQARGSIAKGAPVAFKPFVEPLFSRPQGVGLIETSKHPAAAILYLDWITGKRAQKVLRDGGASPARRDLSESAGVREVPVDVKSFNARAGYWNARYERLIRRAPKLPDPG